MQPILSNLAEELPVSLRPSKGAYPKHPGAVHGKESSYAIKFAGEDLENHQSEAELAQRGADICAFKGALCSSYLNQLFGAENNAPRAVQPEMIMVGGMASLLVSGSVPLLAEE
jgi:hypothetical protein